MTDLAVPSRLPWRAAAQGGLLALAYLAAAKLALLSAIPPGYASPIWPPSGIALAALLVGGPRLWPGVWLGSFAANISIEASALSAFVIASGSSLQAVTVAELMRRHVGVVYRFASVQQVVKFVAFVAMAATIAPTVALVPLGLHQLAPAALLHNWWTWWQGDATGMLVVAPLMLSWMGRDAVRWSRRRMLEGLAFWVLLVLAAHVVFSGSSDYGIPYATTFTLFPFIIWAAFRFDQRGVTTATAAVCAIALWYTLQRGTGPFSMQPMHLALPLLLTFTSTLVVTGLVLCAVLHQLDIAMAELRARQAELESRVAERTRALSESERRFRMMVESVVDYAIVMLNGDGRVASWNAGAQRIHGYGADEIVGQHLSRFYSREDVARGKPELELREASAEGRFEEEGWRVRRDGSTFWASVVVTAVRDDGGRLLGFAKITRDLTERNRVEAELIRAKVAAEKASEAKSQFLANMSHELRTPLNSLLILARLLADNAEANLTPKQVQFAQTILGSGIDLLALINDLLDLAKIESGAITRLNVAPARLAEVAEELERSFRQLALDRRIEFRISLDPALPMLIHTDIARLKQVLKNLLANAFKFTKEGSVSLSIGPSRPGWVAFAVADTGIGIPPNKQLLIFEAFQQADGSTSRQYGGTGLGLSISRELTRLLGGELRLESAPGRGSTFTLYMPLMPDAAKTATG